MVTSVPLTVTSTPVTTPSPNEAWRTESPTCRVGRAAAGWYQRRFGISLDPDTEVLPLIGAKEGIGHAALCFVDPGDIALVPDPGYPVYSVGTWFAGGECHWMPLLEENGWLPDLDASPDKWVDLFGVAPDRDPHFVMLADPYSFQVQNLLMGMDYAYPRATKIGGLASGASRQG